MLNISIDGRNKEWTQNAMFQNNRLEYPAIDINDITIVRRIGSPSTMAEVYSAKSNGIDIACKLLPINSYISKQQIHNEMEIARLVGTREEIYFPFVYDTFYINDIYFYNLKCPFIQYDKSKNFNSSSKWFQYYEYLIDNAPQHTIDILSYKRRFVEPETTRLKVCPHLSLPDNISGGIILSELLDSDLLYYLNTNNLSEKEWSRLLKHIFNAINIMHTKYNIRHNDLHLGNILVNNNIPIIHDFGKSIISNIDSRSDIMYFIGQILDREDIPEKIRDLLDSIIDIVNESNEEFPIKDVLKHITY